MKKHFYSFALCILIFTFFNENIYPQTNIQGGSVSGNWTLSGSPYLIMGHLFIPNGSSLTIAPGVTIEFQGHYKFNVQGQLIAVGALTDSIIFTAADSSTGWGGLRYDNTPAIEDSSIFVYCKFEYGKANGTTGSDIFSSGGAIGLKNFSKIRISNCLFNNNYANNAGGAISCDYSSPVISFNTIINNTSISYAGGGIYCFGLCSPLIFSNIISSNTSKMNTGGGIACQNGASPSIISNIISNNSANYQGGGIMYASSSGILTNNIISNNFSGSFGGGIYCDYGNCIISNNIISNNTAAFSGGGICCLGTPPKIFNCTISNNSTLGNDENMGGGGLFCIESSPEFKNIILYGNVAKNGNGNSVYLEDNKSKPTFYYSDIQGGSAAFWTNGFPYSGQYINNIDEDPFFISPSVNTGIDFNGLTADWSLKSTSPCIDAGTTSGLALPGKDIAGNPRISGCCVDMGAYEYQIPAKIIDHKIFINSIHLFPNPAGEYFVVSFELEIPKSLTMTLTDLSGNKFQEFTLANIQFVNEEIDVSKLSSGVYFLNVNFGSESITRKIVVE